MAGTEKTDVFVDAKHAEDRMAAIGGIGTPEVARMLGCTDVFARSILSGRAKVSKTMQKFLPGMLCADAAALFTHTQNEMPAEKNGEGGGDADADAGADAGVQAADLTIPPALARTPYPGETTIKQRLAGARERCGLSQTAAAKAVSAAGYHVTKKDVQEWELGHQGSTEDSKLGAFARAYGVGMKWLVTGTVMDTPADEFDDGEFDDGEFDDVMAEDPDAVDLYTDTADANNTDGDAESDDPSTCLHMDTCEVWLELVDAGAEGAARTVLPKPKDGESPTFSYRPHVWNETDEATAASRDWKAGIECETCGTVEVATKCGRCGSMAVYTLRDNEDSRVPVCDSCYASWNDDMQAMVGGKSSASCPHRNVVACVVPEDRNVRGPARYSVWVDKYNAPSGVATKPATICLDCETIDDTPPRPANEHPQAGTLRLLYDEATTHEADLRVKLGKLDEKRSGLEIDHQRAKRTVSSLEALAESLNLQLDAPKPKLPLPGSVVRDVDGQLDLLNDVPKPKPKLPMPIEVDPETCLHDKTTEIALDDDGDLIASPDWTDATITRAIECDACSEIWTSQAAWIEDCKADGGTLTPAPHGQLAGTVPTPPTPAVTKADGTPVEAVAAAGRPIDPWKRNVKMPDTPVDGPSAPVDGPSAPTPPTSAESASDATTGQIQGDAGASAGDGTFVQHVAAQLALSESRAVATQPKRSKRTTAEVLS